MILSNLALNQDEYKAYFKGGTAVYKILDTMNRFSEDIDLTVKVVSEQSNTKNKNRLEKSAFGYDIEGLELSKDESENKKGSITAIYKYTPIYNYGDDSLHKPGIIQVEATSFTVSEPFKKYRIEPLIYNLASNSEKEILKSRFMVSDFTINIITLERIFVDKVFTAEFYYLRNMNFDTAKHLYDLTILSSKQDIINLLNNREELEKLISYKREEEKNRKGGIPEKLRIKDFSYFKFEYSSDLLKEFNSMQNKYLLNDKYKIDIEKVKQSLLFIYKYMKLL